MWAVHNCTIPVVTEIRCEHRYATDADGKTTAKSWTDLRVFGDGTASPARTGDPWFHKPVL